MPQSISSLPWSLTMRSVIPKRNQKKLSLSLLQPCFNRYINTITHLCQFWKIYQQFYLSSELVYWIQRFHSLWCRIRNLNLKLRIKIDRIKNTSTLIQETECQQYKTTQINKHQHLWNERTLRVCRSQPKRMLNSGNTMILIIHIIILRVSFKMMININLNYIQQYNNL